MKKYNEFIFEGNIPKEDKYKDFKYNIGDKVLFRVRRDLNTFKGEIFNRAVEPHNMMYCIKVYVEKDKPFYYGAGSGEYYNSEFPKKSDPDRRAYWTDENNVLDIDDGKSKSESIIYLKEYFDKYVRKCDNPTQKKAHHTWNCRYCKGSGMRGYDEIFRLIREPLKDKEIKYQESYENYFNDKPVWFNVDNYWFTLDFSDVRTWKSNGRLLVRTKEKKEDDPGDENWWFINSEKKPIKK
jgi:hypothetical protein